MNTGVQMKGLDTSPKTFFRRLKSKVGISVEENTSLKQNKTYMQQHAGHGEDERSMMTFERTKINVSK